jgi:hypothetical protein
VCILTADNTSTTTTTTAACECDLNYYANEVLDSCDSYCHGEVFVDTVGERYCRARTTYFIGGLLDLTHHHGLVNHARLAVDLINNKSDGWLDEETAQVSLELLLNDTACNHSTVKAVLDYQKAWAAGSNGGNMLDGVIGSEVSGFVVSLHGQHIFEHIVMARQD